MADNEVLLTSAHNELMTIRSWLYDLSSNVPETASLDYLSGAMYVRDNMLDHIIESLFSIDLVLGLVKK